MSAAVEASQDHDPFEVLRNANTVLLHNLRRDDASPELSKQLTTTGMPASSQAYFCDPYTNSYLGPQIRPKSFAVLPEALSRERDRVECMTFMGLLPEIDHAWMTVDNVRPTNFRASTDGVAMLKIAAHPNGRVFMAGKDGNLYELTYSVAYGFWYSVFFVGSPKRHRMCDRLTHKSSSGGAGPVNSVLALFGLRRRADRVLVDVVVDPLRNVLYTLDMAGDIDLFDLGADGNRTTQKNNVYNLWERASMFCNCHANANLSQIPAQTFKEPNKFQVVSLAVVDPTESKHVALVAVSDAGMRFYLSCGSNGTNRQHFRLNMVMIRCPPPEKLWQFLHERQEGAAGAGSALVPPQQQVFPPPDGFSAKWDRQAAAMPSSVYGAYCCGGVTVLAQALGEGDRLEEHPSMRESVTEVGGPNAPPTGAYGQPQPHQGLGKVWAISERPVTLTDNPENGRVRALLATSHAPTQAEINAAATTTRGGPRRGNSTAPARSTSSRTVVARGSGGVPADGMMSRIGAWKKSARYAARPVVPSPPLVASPGGSAGFPGGLSAKDAEKVLPLPELGAQPYSDRRELLCLTGAGLQVLTRLRPVDLLYDLLARNHVEGVRLFFEDFSPDQSAAMCFSIACGLPRDVGAGIGADASAAPGVLPPPPAACGVSSQTVRARAVDAALMNCKPPGFSSPGQSAAGGAGGGGGAAAALGGVIMAEKFANSALHNGLQLFIGRLLRPFWFLPVVVAPPASGTKRTADGKAKGGGKSAPPVVRDLEALRAPLEALRASIRVAFPRAVGEDLAALASKEARAAAAAAAAAAEAATASGAPGGLLGNGGRATAAGGAGGQQPLQLQQQQQQQQQQKPETPQQRHQKALKREALEVHAAYRLVSRAAEAVHMAGVLARAAKENPGAGSTKVPWSSLDGVPLWRLVSGGDEHHKASCLLADLVGPAGNLPADARNGYARELASACRGFFGSGDRRTFEGVELLRRAGAGAGTGTEGSGSGGGGGSGALTAAEEASARQGAAMLAEAAKEWRGERALGADGQLARACAALAGLGRLEAVVDVCMTCARNFGGPSRPPPPPQPSAGRDGGGFAGLAPTGAGDDGGQIWEDGVYQGGGVIGAAQREKARLECYDRVLDTVVGLLKQEQRQQQPAAAAAAAAAAAGGAGGAGVAISAVQDAGRPSRKLDSLITRCLSYKVPELDDMLFRMLEEHDKKLLMSIRTPGVERYLQRGDPELLFRHYMLSKDYPKAVHLMDREARAEGGGGGGGRVHVRYRVDCLLKAISACHKCDLDSAQMVAPGWTLNHAKLRSLEDERDVLLIQEQLLADLGASMAPLERLARDGRGTEDLKAELDGRRRIAGAWTTGLGDPSELYRQASSVFLWEGCLRLLQCCEFDEPMVARKLIRSIIWREVPSLSRDGAKSRTQNFIYEGRHRPGEVEVDDVRQELDKDVGGGGAGPGGPGGPVVFEDDGWFTPLLDKMSALSLELLGHRGSSSVLPVETLCLELQNIADHYSDVGGSAPALCVVKALERAGLSAATLLDAYEFMNRNHYPQDDMARLRRFDVMVYLLDSAGGQGAQPGLRAETVRPERMERLAQDTYTGLDSLRFLSAVTPGPGGDRDSEVRERVGELKHKIDKLLQSPPLPRGAKFRSLI
eukprot:g11539.t1